VVYSGSVFQDLSATTKLPSPPPLSQRARGDKILPLHWERAGVRVTNLGILRL